MTRRNRGSSGPYSRQGRNGNARNDDSHDEGSESVQRTRQNGQRNSHRNQNQTQGQIVPWTGYQIKGHAQNAAPPVQLLTPQYTGQYNTHHAAQYGTQTVPWGAAPFQPNVRGRNRTPFAQPQPHNPTQWQHRVSKYNPHKLDQFRLDSKNLKEHMRVVLENFFRDMDSALRAWESGIQMNEDEPEDMDWESTATTLVNVFQQGQPIVFQTPAANPFSNFSSENVFQKGQAGTLQTPAGAATTSPFSSFSSSNTSQQSQVSMNPLHAWFQGQQQQQQQQQTVSNFSSHNPFQSQQASNNSYNPFMAQSAPNFSNFRTRY